MIREYLNDVTDAIYKINTDEVESAINIIKQTIEDDKQIFLIGNGGSAAIASHICNDFQKGLECRTIALTDNIPLITAWANDDSYVNIFSRQLEQLAQRGDLLIAVSGSGTSQNINEAMFCAFDLDLNSIKITSAIYPRIRSTINTSYPIVIPTEDMQVFEDCASIIGHAIYKELKK